jgi:hypothetical protein
MDVTESPGDLLATGWAAPLVHPTTAEMALGEHACHLAQERDRALALTAGLRAEILSQAALIASLGHRAVDAEGEAARLRRRVAAQSGTIRSLQLKLAPFTLARIDDALAGPCACLADPPAAAVSRMDAPPSRGRLTRWVRR